MPIVQHRPRRKASGGRYKQLYRKTRVFEIGSAPAMTEVGETRKKVTRGRAGITKVRQLKNNIANVIGKDGKAQKVKILNVADNPANINYVRRNILTKGTVIETEAGKAKITSRPGQEGTINAVLVE